MRKQRRVLYRSDCIYLGMWAPKFVVVAFAYDSPLMNNHAANQGIGPCKTQTFPCQLKTAAHIYFILIRQQTLPLLLFLIMIQNHATLREIRLYLQKEISKIYSQGETNAIIKLIMEHCGFPSSQSFLNPDHQPGNATVTQINEIVSDIHTHKPIQYILGETSFYELNIRIDENVLVPRPETEEMIYKIAGNQPGTPGRIIDMGTGSGCIALALKKQYPNAQVTGLELSPEALNLARLNGKHNHLEVQWIQGDILGDNPLNGHSKFDLIVSNPPYVLNREKSMMDRNVLDFEPHAALFVEDSDPLIFYRALARLSGASLSSNGTVWLEINENFGADVARLMSDSGFTQTFIHKDIHEKQRFIEARF